MSSVFQLFIIGVAAFGPCSAHCAPVILPYIAATRRTWREGLKAVSIFLLARSVVYCFLGLLAALFGGLFTGWLHQFEDYIFLVGGLFIVLVGILVIFGKELKSPLCEALKNRVANDNTGPLILGLTMGIFPCFVVLAVLAYIALEAQSLWQGAFYGFAFGMGKFISPLILLGPLASTLPTRLIKNNRIYGFFRRLCGFIIFLIGVNLVVFRLLK